MINEKGMTSKTFKSIKVDLSPEANKNRMTMTTDETDEIEINNYEAMQRGD